jgi:hypothetical protein
MAARTFSMFRKPSSAHTIATCLATAFAVSLSTSAAADPAFLDRFRGTWSGSGKVQREGRSQPRQVTCSITGMPAENRLTAQGSCRAAVIFSRQIGVDLTFDPRTQTYRGTYTGSRIGPAELSGTRRGDTVNLRIRWPRLVNGDTQARMVIRNDGHGMLRITVSDNLSPGGPLQQTSELVLARR